MTELLNIYNYYISSRERTSGDANNYNLSLPNPISLNGKVPSEFRVKILSAVIPFAWNQFNSKNYTTYFTLSRAGTYNGSFFIPAGNYNAYSFADAFVLALEKGLLTATSNIYGPTVTYTYNSDTNKFTFVLPNDATATTITFLNTTGFTQTSLSLGFPINATWSLSNALGASTTSTQQINVNPSRNLYVKSDSLITKNSFDAYISSPRTSNILEVMPIYTLPNQYLVVQPQNPTVSTLSNRVIDRINLSLWDESVDFPIQDFTLNWSLHLVVEEWKVQIVDKIEELTTSITTSLEKTKLAVEKEKIIADLKSQKEKLLSQLNSKDVLQAKNSQPKK